MKVYISISLIVFTLLGCEKSSQIIYTDSIPEIDSNTFMRFTVDENGEIIDTFINKKLMNIEDITSASSLNDSSFYEYEYIDNVKKKKRVFKYSYQKEDFQIYINNDSIRESEKFEAIISLNNSEIKYHIDSEQDYIKDEYTKDNNVTIKFARNINQKLGVHTFSGFIKKDNQKIVFEYKYLVMD